MLKQRARVKLAELAARPEPVATTRFNVAELLVGVARSRNPAAEETVVGGLLMGLEILEFDEQASRLFGKITAHLQTLGKPAGDMDVLIAATALAEGHSLVTRNAILFKNIPELRIEEY